MKGSFLYLLYILNNYQINLYTCIIDENESKYSLLTSSRIIESEKNDRIKKRVDHLGKKQGKVYE